ncbi:MAG TPA: DUF3891 family protein, partial [Hanamia sp.]
GPDKKPYYVQQAGEQKITVTPWPFETEKFVVRFEWRLLNQLQFKSSAEFRKEFLQAEVKETIWEVVHKKVTEKKKKV